MDQYGNWISLGYAFLLRQGCKDLKEKRLLEANVVNIEEVYIRLTLCMKDIEGIGMSAIPPLNQTITGIEVREEVIKKHNQETRKKVWLRYGIFGCSMDAELNTILDCNGIKDKT